MVSTHTYILIFTDDGRCYWLKVHELPQAARTSRGKPIVNLINVTPDTRIRTVVPVREFTDSEFLLFATKNGSIKKTALSRTQPSVTGSKPSRLKRTPAMTCKCVRVQRLVWHPTWIVGDSREDVLEGTDTTVVKGIEFARDEVVGWW